MPAPLHPHGCRHDILGHSLKAIGPLRVLANAPIEPPHEFHASNLRRLLSSRHGWQHAMRLPASLANYALVIYLLS